MNQEKLYNSAVTQESIADMYNVMVKDLKGLKKKFLNLLTLTNTNAKDLDELKTFKGIAKVKITVPDGFKGNLADYCEVLKEKDKYLLDNINQYIRDTEILLANIINSKGKLFDRSKAKKLIDDMGKYIDNYIKDVIETFNINYQNNITSVKVGDVLSSIGEIRQVIDYATAASQLTRKDIIKQVEDITERMNNLALMLNNAIKLLHKSNFTDIEDYELLNTLIDLLNDMVTQITRSVHHRTIIINSANTLIQQTRRI